MSKTLEPEQIGNAVLLGPLSEDEILSLFSTSCLYLATSIYEPFGLAPLEAALCGCGILANDIPSLREVWGDAAMYFTDAASLTALLLDLTAYPATLLHLRRRSLRRAHEFTRERMTDAYVNLYSELAKHQGKTSICEEAVANVA